MRTVPTLCLLSATIACGSGAYTFPGGGGGKGNEVDTDPPPAPTDDTGSDTDPADDTGSDTDPADDTATTAPPDDTADTTEPEDTGFVIEPTGYRSGDTAYNLTATTGAGTPWSLHDSYGSRVALTVGSMNNAQTLTSLESMQENVSVHGDVTFVAFIGRDEFGTTCDATCAADVASTYGVMALYDGSPSLSTFNLWAQSQSTIFYLIDEEMVIRWLNEGSVATSDIDRKIDWLDES